MRYVCYYILFLLLCFFNETIVSQTTIVLQPGPITGKDAAIFSLFPDSINGNYIYEIADAWTWQGAPGIIRCLMEFDLTTIPDSAEILDAKFSMYYHHIQTSIPQTQSSLSGPNTALLQRIVEPWGEDKVCWNNRPGSVITNQVILPESTDPEQDYPDIDVTALVQDMVNDPENSFGFLFRLQTEQYYRRMCFASSDHPVDSLHPKLVITYMACSIDLGNDTTLCNGDVLKITPGSGFTQYLWQDGSADSVYIVDTSGLYWVQATDSNGCMATDSIYVTFLDVDIDLGGDTLICLNDTITLNAGSGFASYFWSTGANDSIITVNSPGLYWVIVSNEIGCMGSDSLLVGLYTFPDFDLGNDTSLCQGDILELEVAPGYESYLWSTGDTMRYLQVTSPGSYWLEITSAEGCETADTIAVSYFPIPEFLWVNTSLPGTIVLDGAEGIPPYEFALNDGDYQSSNEFTGLMPGNYTVYIRDFIGCENDTTVVLPEVPLEIPNFFTPNGDNIHDIWQIKGLYQYPDAKVMIFDRYGKLLVTYFGNENGWDGTYNGKPLPSDTYWYQVVFNDARSSITGDVTIKR